MAKKALPVHTFHSIFDEAKNHLRGKQGSGEKVPAETTHATTEVVREAEMGSTGTPATVEAKPAKAPKGMRTVTFQDFNLGVMKNQIQDGPFDSVRIRYGVLSADGVTLAVMQDNKYWKRGAGGIFSDVTIL